MIVTASALLKSNPHPTAAEIVTFMEGNICRCGTHSRIVAAILQASKATQEVAR
jgi:isoquinoline 1-oxidoreductase alpha subunit